MKQKFTNALIAGSLAVGMIALPLAPASAYEYGGPMRTVWCKVVPAWCR